MNNLLTSGMHPHCLHHTYIVLTVCTLSIYCKSPFIMYFFHYIKYETYSKPLMGDLYLHKFHLLQVVNLSDLERKSQKGDFASQFT